MRRNELFTSTAIGEDSAQSEILTDGSNISEYKIGHTTYIVKTHFNTGGENLSAIIQRLILGEAETAAA